MKPRYDQRYTSDLASGERGLIFRKQGETTGRVVAFVFESEDEDGIHWVAPGFDKPGDAAFSNCDEQGRLTTDGDAIVSIERQEPLAPIEIARNNPDNPDDEVATRKTQQFIEGLGDETLEQARQRAFQKLRRMYGMDRETGE